MRLLTSLKLQLLLCAMAVAGPTAAVAVTKALSPQENYEKHCVDCHGADGKGQTRLGRKSGAKDLTDGKTIAKLSDADIFKTIKFGRKNNKGEEKMDAFADGLSDQEINALVAFVRSMTK